MDFGSSAAPRRILAVDDDPISLTVATILLEAEGCVVTQAASGEEAVHLAASDPPDCIIADLRMPGLSSTELARSLRQVAPQALLLAMSATPPPRLDGYDGVLRKPLSPEGLRVAFTCHASAPRSVEPPSDDSSGILDPAVFERLRRAVSLVGLEEIFSVFFRDTHTRIASIRTADPATIRREAHTIKGGAAMVGALQVARAAAAIESGIDDPGERTRKLDEMEAHCRATELILKQRLKA